MANLEHSNKFNNNLTRTRSSIIYKRGSDINQKTLSLGIASLSKSGTILNKPLSGKNSYTINPYRTKRIAATSSPLKNPPCVKSVEIRSYFWSVFSFIRTEYGDLRSRSLYSVGIQENTDQK